MRCKQCGNELPVKAKFCPECGTPVPKPGGIQVDQRARDVEGDMAGLVAGEGAASRGLDASVSQDVETVAEGGTVTGAVHGERGSHTHIGGTEHHGDTVRGDKTEVRTDGGAYIGRNLSMTGSEFVGRDKTVDGQGPTATELARAFAEIYRRIEDRPPEPDLDKAEVIETVQKIEQEAAQGEEANPRRVERWLKMLAMMAPDILEVTASCLASPIAGVGTVVRKIAERARADADAV